MTKEDDLAPFRADLYRSVADLSDGGSVICVVGAIENLAKAVAMAEIVRMLDRLNDRLNKATPGNNS